MLSAVLLDDSLWDKVPEIRRQEWRLSIRELLDDHSFSIEDSPLVLRLSFTDDEVALKWEVPGKHIVADVRMPRAELATHLQRYVDVCKEMMSLGEADASRITVLDQAKKDAHDEGASLVQRANDAVRASHETARRVFTLLVTLLVDTTNLSVLRRPHQSG